MNSDDIRDLCGLALFLLFGFGMMCLAILPGNTEKNVEPKKEREVILQPYFSNGPNGEMECHLVPVLH